MKLDDFTLDMLKACALRCPMKLPKHDGYVPANSGNWWVMPAKNEAVKKFTKLAKRDLLDRELRGASFAGDHGHVMIGGHRFTFYPKNSVVMRDDFAAWVEGNWTKYLKDDGTERESTKPLHDEAVQVLPIARHSLAAKMAAKEMKEPTDLIHRDAWNTLYDMKLRFQRYMGEMRRDERAGEFYVVTRLQADMLAAMIAHKERNYPEAVSRFVQVAAAALKAAEYEARMHGAKGDENETMRN